MKKHILQFNISKGDDFYVAQGVDLPVVTQAKNLDELVVNINEAVELHLEGEDLAEAGIAETPSVLVNFELPSYA
jgi:predicted RNase H-like HicB family nuclease